ncbi:MAG: hypothetical protein MAG451_02764 [Anaerolineales bacterium]|nr:hypothetical protein [Anaerolineales bacterium]
MRLIPKEEYLSADQRVKSAQHRFTGQVTVQRIIGGETDARVRASSVMFEPAARTYWHVHAGEQVLHVTDGRGWVQKWGEDAISIEPGDVVLFEPGEKHWHGAAEDESMTHIAITTAGERGELAIDWQEEVSELQYPHDR